MKNKRIGGFFVKLEKIGERSCGIVYKAMDKINGKLVTLKKSDLIHDSSTLIYQFFN